ncbi:COP1-interactive protein 1-like [Salvia hispanica]|uniref:COP1-interactive protein 1-like n=1 Tax=Salvia hispanica TaxID=49212 RepID=UPI002009472D|nr:COP1-interactive protein 1-like [Salvia hispanica]XP_047939694.1 COP1-interactive protein 1-like [Salvia hispanica]
MKKLFFFKSQSSNNVSQPATDKQVYWEKPTEKADKSVKNKHAAEDQVYGSTPSLRRSLSFSSGSFHDAGKGMRNYSEQTGSPHSSGHHPNKQPGHHSSRYRTLTPERQTRANFVDTSMVRNAKSMEQYGCTASGSLSDLSDISSNCSSKVLDRYIDGEQMERFETKSNFSTRSQFENGNVVKKPPNIFAPVANDARKQKPKSRSFRDSKTSQVPLPSKDGCNNGYCNESPRKLAKHVVERLSQSKFQPKMRSTEFDSENPITIEDVYGRNSNRYANAYPDEDSPKNFAMDWHDEICDGSRHDESSEYLEKDSFSGDKDMAGENLDAVTDNDVELFKKFKEAEDRALTLSEELQKGNFFQLKGLGVPTLIQAIKSLAEEKVNLAGEVSAVFEDRIAERALFREKLKLGKADLEAQSRKLVKEKNEIQVALEKELDRRSAEWSLKLEKLQSEEHRLRERVRELAEQNVSLQREASTSSEREMETKSKSANADKQLVELSTQLKEAREENLYLQKTISELQEKTRAAEEEGDCIRRKYEEKVCECKDMHQAVSRLQRTCNDQERTIEGLRSLCEELSKKISKDSFDFGIAKLQIEHVRLTGVEHALRKEVESYRADVDSLRRENIDLLNRLKNIGIEGGFSTFKLDRELQSRICSLQSQILPLLTETSQHGRKLIEYVKTNGGFPLNKGPGSATCLDGQVLVEYEVKLQGLERAAENLATSSKTMSYVLQEKSTLMHEKSEPVGTDNQTPVMRVESQTSEDIIRSELKSETLLTSLLRERLYSRELDVEQLQAELAAAIRGNDVLKSEVQNAVDNFSCVNHKMKEVELQMIKKDETVSQLHEDLQDCKKELAILRGILPKVSEERDMLWEEVKRHTESNMLLNSEVNALRKRIEALDEDILMKEGQISILKDSVGKPFDLLATPERTPEFCWSDAR